MGPGDAPEPRSVLSGSPRGATAPCCRGPFRGATARRALSGSPSGSDGARPSGSLRGATAEAQGYCQGPRGERRCPTVRVPSGSDGSKGTVRVPSGSDGAVLSGSLRGEAGTPPELPKKRLLRGRTARHLAPCTRSPSAAGKLIHNLPRNGPCKENFTTKLPRTTLGTGLARTGTNTGTPVSCKENSMQRDSVSQS